MTNKEQAIADLKTAKNIDQWNEIRAKHVPLLTQAEMSQIDGSGLVVEVLGSDFKHFSGPSE